MNPLLVILVIAAILFGIFWAIHHRAQVQALVAKAKAEEQLLLAQAKVELASIGHIPVATPTTPVSPPSGTPKV